MYTHYLKDHMKLANPDACGDGQIETQDEVEMGAIRGSRQRSPSTDSVAFAKGGVW
jgi:hypothetical protein